MSARRLVLLVLLAAAVRLLAIALSDRVVADVERYRKVADHVLEVSWNPYQAPRLYPYPPVWVWIEAASGWLSRAHGVSFALLVKLPTLAAELFIVAWLARRSAPAGWVYALHPVSVMVSAFHGQFDAIALAFVLAALGALHTNRWHASALALAAAIALKSFPILLLPLFVLALPEWRARVRFAALALAPVALLLVPYAADDFPALRRELLGYGGVADMGWLGLWRGLRWLATGALTRSEAARWPWGAAISKGLFLVGYSFIVYALARRRLSLPLPQAALAVLLAFLSLYGVISAQYLLWVVPLGALVLDRGFIAHGLASATALLGFYSFLAPGVLVSGPGPLPYETAGVVWVIGNGLAWLAAIGWLVAIIVRGSSRPGGSGDVGAASRTRT